VNKRESHAYPIKTSEPAHISQCRMYISHKLLSLFLSQTSNQCCKVRSVKQLKTNTRIK